MKNITHDNFMWNFCMICMGIVYGTILTLFYTMCIRLFHLKVCFTLSFSLKFLFLFFPLRNKVIQPRIWASCIVWRVGEIDNIIILANRKSFYLAKLRQTTAQLFAEILTTFFIVLECESENRHRTLLSLLLWIELVEIIV